MMNLVDLQDKLKNLSEEQLVSEMQMPSGQLPQFLVLSEITRRQKMRESFEGQQGQEQTTVAQDVIAAAGMPVDFAGQMAGSMAPQTDMDGNTGAMPQQEMAPMPQQEMAPMPQQMPVQGMADGGIVALRGGSVDQGAVRGDSRSRAEVTKRHLELDEADKVAVSTKLGVDRLSVLDLMLEDPARVNQAIDDVLRGGSVDQGAVRGDGSRTFVRDGIIYIVNDRGEEIPLARQESPTAGNIGPYSSSLGDAAPEEMPTLSDVPPPEDLARPIDPPVTPVNRQELQRDVTDFFGGAITPALQNLDQSAIGQYRTPSLQEDIFKNLAPAADQTKAPFPPNMTPAQAEAYARSAESPGILGTARNITDRALDFAVRKPGAYMTGKLGRALSAAGLPGAGAVAIQSAEDMRDLSDLRKEERGRGGAERSADAEFIRFMANPTSEGAAGILPRASLDPAVDPAVDPTVDPAVDPSADPSADPTPTVDPSGPGAGGIASMGGAYSAGAASVAPSNFQQELMDMLAAREKRAEQDKWLALAQFGLGLMSSKESTLGGAIGESGAPALEALRTGRETAEADRLGLLSAIEQSRMSEAQLALQQQAAAARASAGAGGPSFKDVPVGVITNLMGRLDDAREMLRTVPSPPSPGIFGGSKQDPNAAQRALLTNQVEQLERQLNFAGSPFGLSLGGGQGQPGYDFEPE
jgi:hypothetical protein